MRLVSPAYTVEEGSNRTVAETKCCVISSTVNCAFASLTCPESFRLSKDHTHITGVGVAVVNDSVTYYSHTLNCTVTASVEDVDWMGTIDGMEWSCQIKLSCPALPSDVGAVVVKTGTHEAVGIIFACGSGRALANRMDLVLESLGVELLLPD